MKIKNWSKFQHFKDRRPPWIKLYRDILDDKQWHALDGDAAKLLVNIWLLASEDDGNIAAPDELAFRLRVTDKHINGCLPRLAHWLEQRDISAISTRHQPDTVADMPNSVADVSVYLETETETETETEPKASKEKAIQAPDGVCVKVWTDFVKYRKALKAPLTDTAIDGFKREAIKAGVSLEHAFRTSIENNWRGFKADWVIGKTATMTAGGVMAGAI